MNNADPVISLGFWGKIVPRQSVSQWICADAKHSEVNCCRLIYSTRYRDAQPVKSSGQQ